MILICQACGCNYEVKHPTRIARSKACSRLCANKLAAQNGVRHRVAMLARPNPRVHADYAEVPVGTKAWARVDLADLEAVSDVAWYLHGAGYADSNTHGLMHRLIMRPPRSLQVDHKNGDRLDNRRCNLRLASAADNARNKRKITTRPFKNVYASKSRWYSTICAEGKQLRIGTFDTPEEAAWMYDQYASQLHGEFACLNFEYLLT